MSNVHLSKAWQLESDNIGAQYVAKQNVAQSTQSVSAGYSQKVGKKTLLVSNSVCPDCQQSGNKNESLLVQNSALASTSQQNSNLGKVSSICHDCQMNSASSRQYGIQAGKTINDSLCPECGRTTDEHF